MLTRIEIKKDSLSLKFQRKKINRLFYISYEICVCVKNRTPSFFSFTLSFWQLLLLWMTQLILVENAYRDQNQTHDHIQPHLLSFFGLSWSAYAHHLHSLPSFFHIMQEKVEAEEEEAHLMLAWVIKISKEKDYLNTCKKKSNDILLMFYFIIMKIFIIIIITFFFFFLLVCVSI